MRRSREGVSATLDEYINDYRFERNIMRGGPPYSEAELEYARDRVARDNRSVSRSRDHDHRE